MNPIGPLGFIAAVGGAFALLLLYHAVELVVRRKPNMAAAPAGNFDFGDEDAV